jgi:hypothetical protein
METELVNLKEKTTARAKQDSIKARKKATWKARNDFSGKHDGLF